MNESRKRATGIIIHEGKVLLIKRVKPGMEYFVIPGGGVEDGETVEQGLIREVEEELTLKVEEFRLIGTTENITMPSNTSIHNGLQTYYFYLITRYSGKPEIGGPEKQKMTEANQYHLAWVHLQAAIETISLYPEESKPLLKKLLDEDI